MIFGQAYVTYERMYVCMYVCSGGGLILAELIKSEVHKEVIRTLVGLIEEPLGLGLARLSGR